MPSKFKTGAVVKCVLIVKPTLPVVSGVRVGLALEQMRNRIAAKIAGDAVNVCGCIPLGKQAVELQCALAVECVGQIKAQFIVPAISGDFLNDGIVREKSPRMLLSLFRLLRYRGWLRRVIV